MMTAYTRQCLTELAFFLERRLTGESLNMYRFGTRANMVTARGSLLRSQDKPGIAVSCKTVMCAAGWLIVLYGQTLGLTLSEGGTIRASQDALKNRVEKLRRHGAFPRVWSSTSFELLSAALGITYAETLQLFSPRAYVPSEISPKSARTPCNVARRIREIVARYGGPPRQYVPAPVGEAVTT